MPVQINELIIRANIVQESQNVPNTNTSSVLNDLNKDEIIRECAAMVMEIINNKNQR